MSIPSGLQKLLRFHRGLPEFLTTPLSGERCGAILEQSLRQREENLLRVLRMAVYGNHRSPYLPLLHRAGAELGDVAALVHRAGVEAALSHLASEGVQVSLDEFKGRTPIRRTGIEYAPRPEDFDNPLLAGEFEVTTGGTSGRRTRLTIDLDLLVFETAAHHLFLSAQGLMDRPMAVWRAVPPGSAAIKHALRRAKLGRPLERWFTPNRPTWGWTRWRSNVFLEMALWHGRRAGNVIPRPIYVPLDSPEPVAEWLAGRKAAGKPPVLSCPVSTAVRVADCCGRKGLDIAGAVMWVGGESLTPGREKLIRAAGASTVNGWSLSETGTLGIGCGARADRDEIHLLHSKVAVVNQPRSCTEDAGAGRLLLTTLLPSSPKLLLNVDSGDYGVMNSRRCGCAIEAAGFPHHLHTIRTFDKLTAGGMHFTA
ncbi:MAG TPA: hypothetical protein VLH09_07095, partial [Bryobacteraceae bacterium]|nr:hypothetical protein [Bryobacteraceae bacterium]